VSSPPDSMVSDSKRMFFASILRGSRSARGCTSCHTGTHVSCWWLSHRFFTVGVTLDQSIWPLRHTYLPMIWCTVIWNLRESVSTSPRSFVDSAYSPTVMGCRRMTSWKSGSMKAADVP
jgi:hypothetical protein